MKPRSKQRQTSESGADTEVVLLSKERYADLKAIYHFDADVPEVFGWPHAIRVILDRFAYSGIDLSAASTEEEIAHLAAAELRAMSRGRRQSAPAADPLAALRAELDRELSVLRRPEAAKKLRRAFASKPTEIAKAAGAAARRKG